jgi:hypothetical protein
VFGNLLILIKLINYESSIHPQRITSAAIAVRQKTKKPGLMLWQVAVMLLLQTQ